MKILTTTLALCLVLATRVYAAGDCCAASSSDPELSATCCKGARDDAEQSTGCCEGFTGDSSAAASPDAEAHEGHGGSHAGGRMGGRGGMGGGHHAVMQGARTLIFNHTSITRTIEELPNGVRTVTTTTNPDLVATVQSHPREMDELYRNGGSVRHWDPLFVELSKHHDQIQMDFKDLENGVEVTSTSENPEVVKLIQAHARKVSEFVERGHAAMREASPLPDDYREPE